MRSAAVLFIVLSLAGPLAAQQTEAAQDGPQQAPAPAKEPNAAVDVDRLPLNLNRIQRQLRHTTDLEQREGLKLRYIIQIYGSAPPLELFNEESNLVNGPVPYGAPTHRELINHVTPQPFRAPAADFSALMRWLKERNKKQ